MNSTMWTYFFLVVGILGIVLMNIFSQIMITNEQNYTLIKEITEASMYDAIDWKGYSEGLGWDGVTEKSDPDSMHCGTKKGQYRILKDKFVESFVRRFASNASQKKTYKIVFSDIDECPPKVSLTVTSKEAFSFLEFFRITYDSSTDDNIVNSIDAIFESERTE